MSERNNKLRSRFVLYGVTKKQVAAEMGINARVFCNKVGLRTVNGYVARFTQAQKEWLAERFGIAIEDIE